METPKIIITSQQGYISLSKTIHSRIDRSSILIKSYIFYSILFTVVYILDRVIFTDPTLSLLATAIYSSAVTYYYVKCRQVARVIQMYRETLKDLLAQSLALNINRDPNE